MSATATYFVAATIVTDGPTSACIRAKRARISSGESTDHTLDAARAVRRAGARRRARDGRACRDRLARRARRRPRRSARSAAVQRSSIAVVRQVGVEALGNLRPDLVAARPDRRADHRPLSVRRPSAATPAAIDALGEPTPAGVQDRKPRCTVGRGDDDRQAVGRHREQRHAALVRPEAVACRRRAGRACARCTVARVHLAVERERSQSSAERLAGDAPVLLDARTGRRRCRLRG